MKNSPKLAMYDFGKTTLNACQFDLRFSYFTYVPSDYDPEGDQIYNLAVIVHGTNRPVQEYRDAFIDFAEANQSIILVPVFPAGIAFPGELSSYKFIHYDGIRYDDILFAMMDELAAKYRVRTDKVLMHGFSGGGHFTHRFLYLHPDRLLAASIGAPGRITYLDDTKPWYLGISDFEEKFGVPVRFDLMKQVPVQMIVGGDDVEMEEINDTNDPFWMDGMDAYGKTRVERLKALHKNFADHGIEARLDIVPGVKHEGFKVLEPVKEFFTKSLKK
ncbi:hypothetical protein AB4Y30_05375 [Ornithinibacillus sp. 4-3]|uniref:Hydrolase n=1 Tax=Ornithinibacillus sp. 4-3 TaxID=3231488 RepID=A0AB39HTX2_9BACI